jgi:hypothetical protein
MLVELSIERIVRSPPSSATEGTWATAGRCPRSRQPQATSRPTSDDAGRVEVATTAEYVGVRDTKDRSGPTLAFTPPSVKCALEGIRNSEFGLQTVRHLAGSHGRPGTNQSGDA